MTQHHPTRDDLAQLLPYAILDEPTDGRDAWLEQRRSGIGGSDAPVLLGLSRWRSPQDVWRDKVDPSGDDDAGLPAQVGNWLEPHVAQLAAERLGLTYAPVPWPMHHRDRPWQRANLDGLLLGDTQPHLLEVKTIGERAADHLDHRMDSWSVQVQHYLAVTGLRSAVLAVLVGNRELIIERIDHDQQLADDLTAIEHAFWIDHVLTEVPPPASTFEEVKATYPADGVDPDAAAVDLSDLADVLTEVRELKALESDAKEQRKAAEAKLCAALGEATSGVLDGVEVVTWKATRPRKPRVDADLLRDRHPDVFEQVATVPEPYRRLVVRS